MEYLMTYGWAILIIAIVMVALFQLGIFNTQEPRVQAGACEVYHGSDVGECQGVWPQFVAQFNGATNVNIIIGSTSDPIIKGDQMTMVVWGDLLGNGNSPPSGVLLGQYATGFNTCTSGQTAGGIYTSTGHTVSGSTGCPTTNQWVQYALTYNGVEGTLYIDGSESGSPLQVSGDIYAYQLSIGEILNTLTFNGLIANAQVYNVSLSQPEIQALYQEGIGAAPIDPNHIVGWWPLNGNAQDYSGNGNQGTATGVTYTSTWTNGYTQP